MTTCSGKPKQRTQPILPTNPAANVCASFAAAFRDWRKARQLQLKQIASDLGVAIATVNAWETGRQFPSGSHIERLVIYTGLPPCRLFCQMAPECMPNSCPLHPPDEQRPPEHRKTRSC